LLWKNGGTILLAQTKYSKYGPIIKTFNTSDNQKVNRRQARWLTELAQYHFTLHHKPGNTHNKPDFLSRPPGLDKGEKDNENVTLLPEQHFRSLFLTFKAQN